MLLWTPDLNDAAVALSFCILIFWTAFWLVHIIGIVYGKYKLHRKISIDPERSVLWHDISIIKPLLGVDENLASNLDTFFNMDYPGKYELLFCVPTDDDPAAGLVKSMIEKYSQSVHSVTARLFISNDFPAKTGPNPKIRNMAVAYHNAQFDCILISDAGIRMKPDTLQHISAAMKENVGIVTQVPFVCDRPTWGSTLEKVFFGTAHARIYLSADAVGIICSTGMSSLIRKSALNQVGGIEKFGNYLAEDYFFAQAIRDKGYKCAIASQPAWQNSAPSSASKFHDRLARWARLRFAMLPQTMLLEPLHECVLLGLLASWACCVVFGWNMLIVFLSHLLVWMLLDYALLIIMQDGPLPFGKFEFALTWLFREFSALPLFIRALSDQTIYWGTSKFRLHWGGMAELMPPATAYLSTKQNVDTLRNVKLVNGNLPINGAAVATPKTASNGLVLNVQRTKSSEDRR